MYADDILNLTFFPKGTLLTFSSTAWSATSAEFKNIWKVCNKANHGVDPNVPDLTDKFLRGAESSDFTTARGADSVTLTTANLPSHSHGAKGLSLSGLDTSGLKVDSDGAHEHTLSGGTTAEGNHDHSFLDPGHSHNVSTSGRHGSTNNATNPTAAWDYGDVYWSTKSTVASETKSAGITFKTSGDHSHDFSSTSKATSNGAHKHAILGSITGGSIGGTTDSAGSGTAFSAVPSYYTVIYIIKVA
jgi:hypothetical protein